MAITVLFGTETGNAEECAELLQEAIEAVGVPARVVDMEDYEHEQLATEQMVIIVTSTYGNGDPPANAEELMEYLREQRPALPGTHFAVCGLGDRTYARFCQCGMDFDALLEELGGERQVDRVDCDADYELFFDEFKGSLMEHVTANKQRYSGEVGAPPPKQERKGASAKHPFMGTLSAKRCLNPDSKTGLSWHYEVDLSGSGLDWAPGDSFGLIPQNDPAEVQQLLAAAKLDGQGQVSWKGEALSLSQVLTERACLQRISADLLRRMAAIQGPAAQAVAAGTEAQYLASHHILDALLEHPLLGLRAQDFVGMLRHLTPRLYSVASDRSMHPEHVHFAVATTRFEMAGRAVKGVASCWLEERLCVGDAVPLYPVENRSFRVPPASVPLIMVGPGTGIAPFRGFLQARRGSGGRSWLFFGHRNQASDYLYREELQAWVSDGTLEKLSLAWSRDQAQKIYVQDLIAEQGPELWAWLQQGAALYICGDASAMAPAVESALISLAERQGEADGRAWLSALEQASRYHKDVY